MSFNPFSTSGARSRIALFSLAAVLSAGAMTGCSEDRSNLLPGDTVKEISAKLDEVRELADSGDCVAAINTAQEATRQIEGLSSSVDQGLKRSLREGATQLVLTIQALDQEGCPTADGTTVEEEPAELPDTATTGETGETQAEEPEPTPESGTTGKQEKQPDDQSGNNGNQGGGQGNNPGGTQPETPPSTNPGTGGGSGTGGVGPGTGGVGPPSG